MILLQETLLSEDTQIRTPGYTAYHLPAIEGQTRGCSILVKTSITSSRIENPVFCGERTEVIGVTLKLSHEDVHIYNIYHHPEAELDASELLALCATSEVFIGGDFNAHHEVIGSPRNNRNGCHLAEALESIPEATLLNNGEPTHIAGGILDLSFTSPRLGQGATWEVHEHLASDHFAIATSINCTKPTLQASAPRWNTKKADWPLFRRALQNYLQSTEQSYTLDEMEQRLVDAFHQAADTAIPQTRRPKQTYKDSWYYDSRVKEYNHRINQARKLNRKHNTQTTRDLLRATIRTAREGTKKIRIEKWLEWCSGMNSHSTLSELWRQVKQASGRKTPAPPTHTNPEGEALRLIHSYVERASSNQLPQEALDLLEEQVPEQEAIITQACRLSLPSDTAFTTQELKRALKPKPDTAAGADKITYSMIRQGGPPAHEELLNIINSSYANGRLPSSWKEATIQPIPKPKEPGKTRPISLLSCLGKTAERMVLNRLQYAAGPLHDHIFAYTRGLGTRDCLLDMLTTIADTKAVVIFLDMEKAFELANAKAILTALARKGVGGKLLQWTKDFLTGRRARVRFQGRLSQAMQFDNGTPQGSILSPYLFNILMEELVTLPLARGAKLLCYADDIALITSGSHHMETAQEAIARVARKCLSLGLKINSEKTKAIYFNSNRPEVPLRVQQTEIEWVLSHQYLGIWLDCRLNLQQLVRTTKDRVKARLNVMRAMTATEGGANFRVLRLFYLQAIRSIIDYAAPLLATISTTQMGELEKLQNEALRIMLGAPRWTRLYNMRAETELPQVYHRVHAMNTSLLVKKATQPKHARLFESVRQCLAQDEELFTRKTWARKIARGMKALKMQSTFLSVKSDTAHPDFDCLPPWSEPLYSFTAKPLTGRKAGLTQASLTRQARLALHAVNAEGAEVYYTDGSVDPTTNRAAAAFVSDEATGHFRLPDGSSTLQTELVAIEKALQHAVPRHKDIVLHSDSLGAIQCLQQEHITDNIHLITSIHATAQSIHRQNRKIAINWIPSHTNIRGNDLADETARNALKLPTVTHHIPTAKSQVQCILKAAVKVLRAQEVRQAAAEGGTSANWYLTVTTDSQPLPTTFPRHTQTRMHRLRLGFRCRAEIIDTLPQTCKHCDTPTHAPLLHYIEDCVETARFLERGSNNAPHILKDTPTENLLQMVNTIPPPR